METQPDHAVILFTAIAAQHGVAWSLNDSPKSGTNALRVNGKIHAALTHRHIDWHAAMFWSRRLVCHLHSIFKWSVSRSMTDSGRERFGWVFAMHPS